MFSMELPCMEILIGSRDLLDGQLRHSALPYMSLTLERRKGVVTVRQYIDLAIKDGLFALD